MDWFSDVLGCACLKLQEEFPEAVPRKESHERNGKPEEARKKTVGPGLGPGLGPDKVEKNAGRWHTLAAQRSLHPVLSCCLSTAEGTHFCVLCCQPLLDF